LDSNRQTFRIAGRIAASLLLIAAVTFCLRRVLPVNATTAGFAFLLAILLIATYFGVTEAVLAAVLAMCCFNFFFLPPIGAFTIADPQNWVALFTFLATAITASQLSIRARQRAQEAMDRRQDMERLYALSRAILLAAPEDVRAARIGQQIALIYERRGVALYDAATQQLVQAGPEDLTDVSTQLRDAAAHGVDYRDASGETLVTAVRLGGKPIGSLAIRGAPITDTALQSLSNLVAIGLERARAQEASSRAEAERQSEQFKSTLLDAIAHEFKTPLTAMRAAATELLAHSERLDASQRELAAVLSEETDRLANMVTEAIRMARIEAGNIEVRRWGVSVSELMQASIQSAGAGRSSRIQVEDAAGEMLVNVDRELIAVALGQLIGNALKFSPGATAVTLRSSREGDCVVLSVRDEGPGIPEHERGRIFEKFYRASTARRVAGTGLGLAIAREIVEAHGGELRLESEAGGGSEFSIVLPAAEKGP